MSGSEEKLKNLLTKVKEESENTGLKLNIQKTKTIESGPITSWQIDGETIKTVTNFISWAPKSLQRVTAAVELKDACSLEEYYGQSRQHMKKQRCYWLSRQSWFYRSHVWM